MKTKQKVRHLKFFGWEIYYYSLFELLVASIHTFIFKTHFVKLDSKPFIIDCGSNIGLTVIYYKRLYPHAKIIAFEPDPFIFKILQKNIDDRNLSDVKLINAAVSDHDGNQKYYKNSSNKSSWGNSLKKNSWYNEVNSSYLIVRTFKLSKYIRNRVDLLKMDIEGSETEVLAEIESKLSMVNNLDIEFHGSRKNLSNKYEKIIEILKRNGYRYRIVQGFGYFRIKRVTLGTIRVEYPLMLGIYAYKK